MLMVRYHKAADFSAIEFWKRRVLRLIPAINALIAIIALKAVCNRMGLFG